MDTSEDYIKQCDCPEIQEQSPCHYSHANNRTLFSSGDKVHIDKYRKGSFKVDSEYNFFIGGWWRGKMNHLWLPRQDQIQEMMCKTESAFCIYQMGDGWGGEIYRDRDQVFTTGKVDSPEQVWLAFYFYEKHQGVWDGEKWLLN